jgi:hypothetical protein
MRRASVCLWRTSIIAAFAASVAGCSSQFGAQQAALSGPLSGATVTFESIDGPPADVFQRLVTALNDEAGTQRVAVVSRSAPATYRVRGYMSALVAKNKTSFAWVWDVYDADKNRVLRISGEEPAATAGRRRDAWAAADEQVLRGMSRNGMERIAAFLNSGPPAPAPEPALVILTSARDDSPEAAGIFPAFGSQQQPPASTAEAEPDVAAPPPPPKAKKKRSASTIDAAPAPQSTALVTSR